METEGNFPLDVSDFRCTSLNKSTVSVVFDPTNRQYTYFWHDGELDLSRPEVVGQAGPHPPEVIDCLARAVAYKAVKDAGTRPKLRAEYPEQTPAAMIQGWLPPGDCRRMA
jgi:hypothetical protein